MLFEIPARGYRDAAKYVSQGTGFRTGRRPSRQAVSKADLMELVVELHARGLGFTVIGFALGYSPSLISRMFKDAQLPRQTPGTTARAILQHLPPELAARVRAVKMRSEVAHTRAAIKAGLIEPPRVVHVLPED